jgi:peroxiredoxin
MDPYLKIMIGDPLPRFHVETTEGEWIDLRFPRKEISLINFFIIKCPFCRDGLNFFKKELWGKFEPSVLDMICIGRDHTLEEVREFKTSKSYPFVMAADPGRAAYEQFALQKVPRNFLVDREGKIIHETRGFNETEYRNAISLIEKLCR